MERQTTQKKKSKDIYSCTLCNNEKFRGLVELRRHALKHVNILSDPEADTNIFKKLKCEDDEVEVKHQDKKKPYACLTCGKAYKIQSFLAKHEKLHKSFITINEVSTDTLEHACKIRGINCESALHLKEHVGQAHSTPSVKAKSRNRTFKCLTCKKIFTTKKKLNEHENSHSKSEDLSKDCNSNTTKSPEVSAKPRLPYKVLPGTCEICGKTYTSKYYLKIHRNMHTKQTVHRCELCQQTFTLAASLKQHYFVHTGEKPFNCTVCGKSFAKKYPLVQHMRLHKGILPYKCDQCFKGFNYNSALKFHMVKHTGLYPLKCEKCDKGFCKPKNLRAHKEFCEKEDHSTKAKGTIKKRRNFGTFPCKFCKKVYHKIGKLDLHLLSHAGDHPFFCHICERGFIQKQNYNSHVRTHAEESERKRKLKRVCNICGKEFSKVSNMKEHYRLHIGDLRFECSYCSKRFNSKINRDSHVASIHTRDFPFKCTFCDKGYTKKYKLEHHLKTHDEEKEDDVISKGLSDSEKSD